MAVNILNECFEKDREMTHDLLVKKLERWGNITLLGMAHAYSRMGFMKNDACQQKLTRIWRGRMALRTSKWKIFCNMLFPVVVFCIKFSMEDEQPSEKHPESRSNEHPQGDDVGMSLIRQGSTGSCRYELPEAEPHSNNVDLPCRNKTTLTSRLNAWIYAMYYFNSAPVVKFCYHTISQVVFLCIFSYFLLCDLHPLSEPNSPGLVEIFVLFWTATLVVEEIRQIYTSEGDSLRYKLTHHCRSDWNKLDIIALVMFIASIVLRILLEEPHFYWARTCYCFTLGIHFMRVMQIFDLNQNIGPKVLMIRQMLTDLMFFMCILLVFLLAFGVAYQALRYPNSEGNLMLLKKVVHMPYWQMYGELFLEELEGHTGDCSTNKTEWSLNPNIERCPEQSKLVVGLLAFYTIITHVLLLSLLVAMFTQTFQQVHDSSEVMWRFNLYGVISEYLRKPTIAPPFILFNHVWRLCKYVYFRRRGKEDPNDLQREFTGEKKKQLEKWLKKMNKFIVEMESTEKKKKHLEDLQKAMHEYIAEIQKRQDTSGS